MRTKPSARKARRKREYNRRLASPFRGGRKQLRCETLESRVLLDGSGIGPDGQILPEDPVPPIVAGAVSGRVWVDADGNRAYDGAEVGQGGVVVYSDLNFNGFLDFTEPATVTEFDDPLTDFDEGGLYTLDGLQPGWNNVRQVTPDGFEQTFPSLPDGYLPPPWGDASVHVTFVEQGQTVDGIDFGNQAPEPGAVTGNKWEDINGNGVRDEGEGGLAGVTIYSDRNMNGIADPDEPQTVTLADDPATDFDESGQYWLEDLEPGIHWIKEVVPEGYQQTFPNFSWFAFPAEGAPSTDALFAPIPPFPGGGWHDVVIESGATVESIDFGNQAIVPGSISGSKWEDVNGDGLRSSSERGLAGVTVYLDLNYNQQLDADEPSVVTQADDPTTDFDEAGLYTIEDVDPGFYLVREVVPEGYQQTFPLFGYVDPWPVLPAIGILPPADGAHYVNVGVGQAVGNINFGNQPLISEPGSVSGRKWEDLNGNAARDPGEPGLAGVTIFADLNFNGVLDDNEPATVTMEDIPETDFDETGLYTMELEAGDYLLLEVVPDGYEQTFPNFPVIAIFPPPPSGHYVTVNPGGSVDGLDFGNRPVESGFASGTVWNDVNGDGLRDSGELGVAGVTVYADYNFNGQLDLGEPSTETIADLSNVVPNDTGNYVLEVRPGFTAIRQIVPDGSFQTFPTSDAASPSEVGAHFVSIESGVVASDLDFGNQQLDNFLAAVSGRAWEDTNGNGIWDGGEVGQGGVTIYSDLNLNGLLDANEPSAVTEVDDPFTDFDEGGLYAIADLNPGFHFIREVVPNGYVLTFPISIAASPLEQGGHAINLSPGEFRDGLNFGNHPFDGTLPGDFNANGTVDRADLEVWEEGYGTNAAASTDGFAQPMTGRDFLVWQRNLGRTAPATIDEGSDNGPSDSTGEDIIGPLRVPYRPDEREAAAVVEAVFATATVENILPPGVSAAASVDELAVSQQGTAPRRARSADLAAAIDAALDDEEFRF
ncbi:MAG: SdrD B-like domain-containing protein [Planctomycetota bacterium]